MQHRPDEARHRWWQILDAVQRQSTTTFITEVRNNY